jgi:hypothetical protein
MKSEEVVLVGATGAAFGAVAHDKLGLTTGNAVLDAIIGAGIAVSGYLLDKDIIADGLEGFGIGFFLSSVL